MVGPGRCPRPRNRFGGRKFAAGFTLIELVIIIVVLGVLAAVAIPKFAGIAESSRIAATQQELQTIKRAIVGNPEVVAGGTAVDCGFEGDVGLPPSRLEDLVTRPDTIPPYNALTRLGWNGPYLSANGADYLTDAWATAYGYDPAHRRLVSTGGPDSIIVTF